MSHDPSHYHQQKYLPPAPMISQNSREREEMVRTHYRSSERNQVASDQHQLAIKTKEIITYTLSPRVSSRRKEQERGRRGRARGPLTCSRLTSGCAASTLTIPKCPFLHAIPKGVFKEEPGQVWFVPTRRDHITHILHATLVRPQT